MKIVIHFFLVFSAGLGVSRYALIFQFDWQARRCNRLKQRELVPRRVQKLFIMSNYLWLVAGVFFFGLTSMAGIFVWIRFVIYLKIKWLRILE